MDARTLSEVMGGSQTLARYQQLLPGYENAMRAANINNANRAAMFAAQIGHESVGLRYMEEIASGAAYNGRSDLGNIYPGDGPRYKGSGPIQLTGRHNFRAFTKWANSKGHTNIDFEAQPHLVRENPKWGFLAASWYWTVARPQLNALSDARNLDAATRAINGGLNGIADRRSRYNKALAMGNRLLPGAAKEVSTVGHVIDYSRDQIAQDTFYNCGPASVQTAIKAANGNFRTESEISGRLGTHRGGTDYIGQFPAVLNHYIPGAGYKHADVTNYPSGSTKDTIWSRIKSSVNAGNGVIVNIVAPPSNYPKAVAPSTISPAYSGGTVYHYIAVMGWEESDQRKVWVADSGFSPYGYWLSFDQLCTLVVPKGYAYSTAKPKVNPEGDNSMTILSGVSAAALNETRIASQESLEILRKLSGDIKKILAESMITNEQLAGPERDGNGNLKWTGWDADGQWAGTEGKATVQAVVERLTRIENLIQETNHNV